MLGMLALEARTPEMVAPQETLLALTERQVGRGLV